MNLSRLDRFQIKLSKLVSGFLLVWMLCGLVLCICRIIPIAALCIVSYSLFILLKVNIYIWDKRKEYRWIRIQDLGSDE